MKNSSKIESGIGYNLLKVLVSLAIIVVCFGSFFYVVREVAGNANKTIEETNKKSEERYKMMDRTFDADKYEKSTKEMENILKEVEEPNKSNQ